ncbi:hypothetical protein ACAH01_03225 [Halomicrobium sp. HM KBTZ05]|uniref:hypothetical protein n=1 Tax=Halomicrobium sp. HM KBTZ05 TaxID=3242663 RepID=UPI003557FD1F
MPSTRRSFLTGTGAVVALLSGCTAPTASESRIAKLAVTLDNRTGEDQVFHFAVETAERLRAWHSHEVSSHTSETVVTASDENFEPVGIHGVVDDQTARGDLLTSNEREVRETCLRVTFRCSGEKPAFLQNVDISC